MLERIKNTMRFWGKFKAIFMHCSENHDPIINPAKGSEKQFQIVPDFCMHFLIFYIEITGFPSNYEKQQKKPFVFFANPEPYKIVISLQKHVFIFFRIFKKNSN